jgi:enamine deaminase RidA (YjgF/YER057c/UK114 family)
MIERFGSGGPYEDLIGYSRVVRADQLFIVAGCTSIEDGKLVHVDDAYGQAMTAFGVGIDALEAAGCPRANIISSRMNIVDRDNAAAIGRAHWELFDQIRPAAAMIVVAGFIDARMLVEIELTGWVS